MARSGFSRDSESSTRPGFPTSQCLKPRVGTWIRCEPRLALDPPVGRPQKPLFWEVSGDVLDKMGEYKEKGSFLGCFCFFYTEFWMFHGEFGRFLVVLYLECLQLALE